MPVFDDPIETPSNGNRRQRRRYLSSRSQSHVKRFAVFVVLLSIPLGFYIGLWVALTLFNGETILPVLAGALLGPASLGMVFGYMNKRETGGHGISEMRRWQLSEADKAKRIAEAKERGDFDRFK